MANERVQHACSLDQPMLLLIQATPLQVLNSI